MVCPSWKAIFRLFGFFKSPITPQLWEDDFPEHAFYTEEKRRNERLAAIASEISALNIKRLKAKEQKKNQKVFEDQMTALMAERLRIETGKEMGQ